MKYPFSALVTFLLLSIAGCGGGGGGSGLSGGGCSALSARTSAINEKILNGESCNQTARSAVVALIPIAVNGEQLVPAGICTGTLVTLDDIITSAHCFVGPFVNFGDSLAGFVVLAGGRDGEIIPLTNLAIHPLYDGSVGSRFDIAMATLDRVPRPAIGPVPVLISQATVPGQEFSAFGYGTNDKGRLGELKAAEFTIADIRNGNILAAIDDNSDASICSGDSGGPAVQNIDGITSLIAVNSFAVVRGANQCPALPALVSGFVDIQNESVLNFIFGYAPDVAVR